jgi:hypothetical protein
MIERVGGLIRQGRYSSGSMQVRTNTLLSRRDNLSWLGRNFLVPALQGARITRAQPTERCTIYDGKDCNCAPNVKFFAEPSRS